MEVKSRSLKIFNESGPPARAGFLIKMRFDTWQMEIIKWQGSLTLLSGRQVGKSTTVGKRISEQMQKYPGSKSLTIAPAQRQSSELYIKTMFWLMKKHNELIEEAGGYKDDPMVSSRRNMELRRIFEQENGLFAEYPTKTTVKLKNGSINYALPAGKSGIYLRTYALDFLNVDEAAYVPDPVYNAIRPMIAVARKKGLGWETFLSTPFGNGGFFHDACFNDDFRHWYKSSEDCDRVDKKFLSDERKRLSKLEYAQEYLGQFVDEFQQLFPTKLIKDRMTFIRWIFKEHYNKNLSYYLGGDLAGPGIDTNAFVILEMEDLKKVRIVTAEEDDEKNTAITRAKLELMDEAYNFKRMFLDSGGFGCGVVDELKERLGRKVIGLDNAKKSLDKEGRTGKIFKEDLYSNARVLMEKNPPEIDIINNHGLLKSLRAITFEHTADKNLKIFGKGSHLAEAFVRACWAVKSKGLNLYIY